MDLNGQPLPTKSRHFHKRSAPLPEENWYWWDHNNVGTSTDEGNNFVENATYFFEAFGEGFHLNLTKDTSFISPSLVLEFIGDGKSGALDAETPTHCFYSGNVNGHTESSAVLSLCLGMVSSVLSTTSVLTW